MRKIIFLENMTVRQKKTNIDFSKFKYLEHVLGDIDCNEILEKFETDDKIFDQYDVIIIHDSIYHESKRQNLFKLLERYCGKNDKSLVRFSGYNTQSSFSGNVLSVSAKKLYENIEIYLSEYEKNQSNLLMLSYGKHWNLNPLLNTLEALNIFTENHNADEKFDFDDFEDDYRLLDLQRKILTDEEYSILFENISNYSDEITIDQISTLADNLHRIIKVKVYE